MLFWSADPLFRLLFGRRGGVRGRVDAWTPGPLDPWTGWRQPIMVSVWLVRGSHGGARIRRVFSGFQGHGHVFRVISFAKSAK